MHQAQEHGRPSCQQQVGELTSPLHAILATWLFTFYYNKWVASLHLAEVKPAPPSGSAALQPARSIATDPGVDALVTMVGGIDSHVPAQLLDSWSP